MPAASAWSHPVLLPVPVGVALPSPLPQSHRRTARPAYSILIVSLRLPYVATSTLTTGGPLQSRGELQIDPSQLGSDAVSDQLELVVPYTEPALTRTLLRKAVALTAGLQARISLVAVHAVPFPADFHWATCTHTFLVDQLMELAAGCPLPVNPQVVLARSREDGFRYALRPESTVLVGTHRHLRPTSEERLAGMLVSHGHRVVLLHIEQGRTSR